MDILLVNPPNVFFEDKKKMIPKKGLALYPPAGILYIAAMLKKKNIEVGIVDVIAEGQTIAEIEDFIAQKSVKVIGLTSTTPQIRGAIQLATSIKEKFGNKVKIVLGGPHVSLTPDFISKFRMFDVAILGEGEYAFTDLAKKALDGEEIKGVYKSKRIENLDSLPLPARDLVNQNAYYIEPFGCHFVTIHTIRGCPFNCTFCSNPIGKGKTVYRSIDNVLEEIEYCVKDRKAKIILFTDDTFTLNMKRAAEICDGMLKREIKVKWICETRANLLNKELLLKMRAAGCIEIQFGVETGSERLRNEIINKHISDEAIINAFRWCHNLGIECDAFCMLGLPEETREDMLKTLEFSLKIKPDILGLHLTVLFPSTQLYNRALQEGKIDPDFWYKYALGEINEEPIYIPDGFTLEEVRNMQKYIYKNYYFKPPYIWRRFLHDLKYWRRLKNDFNVGLQLFFKGGTSTGRQ